MKIPNKQVPQQTVIIHSLDIDFESFIKILAKIFRKVIFFYD